MDSEEIKVFLPDKGAGKERVREHGSGGTDWNAPMKDL